MKAFLEGHTNLKNDMPFVIATLNADHVFWMLTKDVLKQRLYTDTAQISQNISTETVSRSREENITASYRYPGGERGTTHTRINTYFKQGNNNLINSWLGDWAGSMG